VRNTWSNIGANSVHLFAPGGQNNSLNDPTNNILTTGLANGRPTLSGTSFAAPHVAGVAALIMNRFPNATPAQVKWAILDGADKGTRLTTNRSLNGLCITGGRLNAHRALQRMQSLQNLTNHDMTYGVHHIRNAATLMYLDISGSRAFQNVFTYDRTAQRWIVQRNGNNFQLRTFNSPGIPGFIQMISRNTSNNQSVIGTTVADITIQRSSAGTVMFRHGNFALAPVGGFVDWVPVSSAANQWWHLEPHRLTYQRGNVNQLNGIDAVDVTWVSQHITGARQFTALEIFLADADRDGKIDSADLTQLSRFTQGLSSVLD
jgi:hypothetical protein